MNLLCIDIGNSTTHAGRLCDGTVEARADLPTNSIADPATGAPFLLTELGGPSLHGLAFCSVVPQASMELRRKLAARQIPCPVYALTAELTHGLAIDYPAPEEIGPDRLANAYAAQALGPLPAIVVDLGTAVTFDIVSHRGYEGGIIAPGLALMTDYLHQRTALLPLLNPASLARETAIIGKSTAEAMRIGASRGYAGMIRELAQSVSQHLIERGDGQPTFHLTGGSAGVLPQELREEMAWNPDLTLQGLYEAFCHNQDHLPQTRPPFLQASS